MSKSKNIKIIKWTFRLYFTLIFGILLPAMGVCISVAYDNPFLCITAVVLLAPIFLFAVKKLCDLIQELYDDQSEYRM